MNPVPTRHLNAFEVLALGCFGIVVGAWLKKKLPVLDRLFIPTSIVGGMVFALVALALHNRVANFDPDTVLRDIFMIAFIATIGLSARLELVRRGGMPVLLLLALASVGAALQNLLGIGLAKALGVNPLLGIVSGSVALTGGPATALAFGSTFEHMGVAGATETGLAAATFGIAVAGLLGGYIGAQLIRRHKLVSVGSVASEAKSVSAAPVSASETLPADDRSGATLLGTVLLIGVAMGIGQLISLGFERVHFILPAYIGAMIAAAAIRNINDRARWFAISQYWVNECGIVSLYLFIVIAVLSLRLWELAHLVLPLIVMLAAQVALCWLMCVTICFWVMGRDYRAAVMSSGFCGFMLGITANAVASMEELVEKYGPAPEAFLVVPIVGAFLIDFVNSLLITFMANWVR